MVPSQPVSPINLTYTSMLLRERALLLSCRRRINRPIFSHVVMHMLAIAWVDVRACMPSCWMLPQPHGSALCGVCANSFTVRIQLYLNYK